MSKLGGIPIGGRIGLLLVAAVLPLAVLGAAYAWIAGETARTAEMRARYETARVVAGAVESVVEGASRATDVLIVSEGIAAGPERCRVLVARLLTLVDSVADVAILSSGERVCGLVRTSAGLVPMNGEVQVVQPAADAAVAIGADGQPALRVVRTGQGGNPIAVVHVGLQPIWRRLETSIAGLGRSRVFILTEAGGVIADPEGVVQTSEISAVIAAVNSTSGGELPVIQVDAPEIGFVSIARVGNTSLRIAVTSDGPSVNQTLPVRIALVAGLPILFLVAAVGIAWFGVDRLVNRWVRQLSRATRRYGEGNLSVRVGPMPHAPEEFQALGDSFDAMASRIEARSVELERALAEKDHFVRELHHRVKNNFQMIASLLTLQRREARGETEAAIREAHDRVQALAAAYRASYADGETGSVPIGSLVTDLVERLRESAQLSSRAIAIDTTAAPISMHLDRAIPFALLLTELLVPVLETVGPDDEDRIRIETTCADEDLDTIVTRVCKVDDRGAVARPLSDRLARAYAAQLGATVARKAGAVTITLSRAA